MVRLHSLRSFPRSNSFRFWANQYRAIRTYWKVYGGFSALIRSPYVQISLLLTLLSSLAKGYSFGATEIAVGVLPNLLGFTVGAMAIVLAFSSAELFVSLAERGEPESFFIKLTANLVHFIGVQVLALTSGIAAKITDLKFFDPLVMFLLYYAVLVAFSAGLQLFQTASIYNAQASLSARRREEAVRQEKQRTLHSSNKFRPRK